MVYVNIPYSIENDRVDRETAAKELRAVDISDSDRYEAFEAIYNKRPRGVHFTDLKKASQLQNALAKLGVPYRLTKESDYKYEEWTLGDDGTEKVKTDRN
jgi:hypothetical protein